MGSKKNKKLSDLNRRLSELMVERNLTIQALAEKSGIALGTVQKLITDSKCNPTVSSLDSICKALEIPITDLLGGPKYTHNSYQMEIPLFDFNNLYYEVLHFKKNKYEKFEYKNVIQISEQLNKSSFATRIPDNSFSPIFPKNSILIFDEKKSYYDGAYALISFESIKKIVLKQLLIDEPNLYIKSINPFFSDTISLLNESNEIVATLLQAQMEY